MRTLPLWLNIPPFERRYCVNEDIRPQEIGVNHNTWLVDPLVNGEDAILYLGLYLENIRKMKRSVFQRFSGTR